MSMLNALAMEADLERAEARARRLASENERLRELLAVTRAELNRAAHVLNDAGYPHASAAALDVFLCSNPLSDPDVQPESGETPVRSERCDCELRNRRWNPNTKTCEFCRRRYAD